MTQVSAELVHVSSSARNSLYRWVLVCIISVSRCSFAVESDPVDGTDFALKKAVKVRYVSNEPALVSYSSTKRRNGADMINSAMQVRGGPRADEKRS